MLNTNNTCYHCSNINLEWFWQSVSRYNGKYYFCDNCHLRILKEFDITENINGIIRAHNKVSKKENYIISVINRVNYDLPVINYVEF